MQLTREPDDLKTIGNLGKLSLRVVATGIGEDLKKVEKAISIGVAQSLKNVPLTLKEQHNERAVGAAGFDGPVWVVTAVFEVEK